ncbi:MULTISPECIES: hypothetical protein [Nostocales]|uniref:Uncharacterized protein n=3 Tax=Nostocales TaxID=1161 RepID=A0A0C1RF89_9CYAN|nr:hypothetical protein [Tolypothrix bouteillei]KAF3886844.1 hypothetical protein DA73_0400016140 [Tolypothrix bouteillei VB521301]
MHSQDTQTIRVENKHRSRETNLNYTSYQQQSNLESMEQEVHKAIPSQTSLNPLVRNGLIVSILALLFVASIYYGVINP